MVLASCIKQCVLHRRLYSTAKALKELTITSEKKLSHHFVDFRKVRVIGGNGGDGCVSFLSIFQKEFAGPDGGDGGNGGHVIFQVDYNTKSLKHVTSVCKGNDGVKGRNKNCHGKCAEHVIFKVPCGTLIKDPITKNLITNLSQEDDYFLAARGGAGGKGNYFFLSNENRAPAIAETGGIGEEKVYHLEMQTMAHAGLIGFPNAGKSTLLRALSRARPKVAAYPFTTLRPHVGIVEYDDHTQVAVADIPGLIKGAHLNYGLGFSFLRHIQRCICLLYVLDLSVDEPWAQLNDLKIELDEYEPGLSQRPHAVIANKIDLAGATDKLVQLRRNIDLPVFPVSAKNLLNIDELKVSLREMYDKYGTSSPW